MERITRGTLSLILAVLTALYLAYNAGVRDFIFGVNALKSLGAAALLVLCLIVVVWAFTSNDDNKIKRIITLIAGIVAGAGGLTLLLSISFLQMLALAGFALWCCFIWAMACLPDFTDSKPFPRLRVVKDPKSNDPPKDKATTQTANIPYAGRPTGSSGKY